jgi:hypothetical protein
MACGDCDKTQLITVNDINKKRPSTCIYFFLTTSAPFKAKGTPYLFRKRCIPQQDLAPFSEARGHGKRKRKSEDAMKIF